MTDHDLATVRDWCRANGVSVVLVDDGDKGGDVMYHLRGRQQWMGDEFDFWCQTEQKVYAVLWQRLQLWLASVRNLDAVVVEGPYEAEYYDDDDWRLYSNNGEYLTDLHKQNLSEQTDRTIANILNREYGK